MSRGERKAMIAPDTPGLSLSRQCRLLSLSRSSFDVQIVPHTWTQTALHAAGPGTPVNLECDMVGKYVLRSLSLGTPSP